MFLSFASLILATTALPQGSLNPPGAPAPTMKALDQIEPRTGGNIAPLLNASTAVGTMHPLANFP